MVSRGLPWAGGRGGSPGRGAPAPLGRPRSSPLRHDTDRAPGPGAARPERAPAHGLGGRAGRRRRRRPLSPGAVASAPPAAPATLFAATSLPGAAHTDDATPAARPRFLPSSRGPETRACALREGVTEPCDPAPSAGAFLLRHFRLGGVFERSALFAAARGFLSARERVEMSARRRRSRSRSGAAGERGGGGARRSGERGGGERARPEGPKAGGRRWGRGGPFGPRAQPHPPPPPPWILSAVPASPPSPAPTLRRSQRKSGSAFEAPPQPSTPAPRTTINLKKIVPQTAEATSPGAQKSIAVKKIVAQTPEAAPPVARKPITVKKLVARTTETPTSRGRKSAAKKNMSPSTEVTLTEKENCPPVQESAPLDKGSSPVTAGPALEVTATMLGPLTPNAVTRPDLMDARDLEMSRKVRRSYSRLDDLGSGSTSTPNYRRRSFFGFDRLLSGEELENVSPVVEKEPKSQAVAPTAEPWGPDFTLPGITMTKEKRRKRKAPEILKSELDEWAAAMNAQFEAAEKFDLLVE
ncbi:sororin [Vombatus ursinus]|uniref:sororin n=1 Tax=Vombatus ursinus TaxID=29139 RepID=UPI000FFCF275|nr:sororin [Vombatus ursinus]